MVYLRHQISININMSAADVLIKEATALADELSLTLHHSLELKEMSTPYVLNIDHSGVSLCQTAKGAAGPISANFDQGKNRHRRLYGGGNGQLIAKAAGLKKSTTPRVFDATAGLGRDAFVLASLGCEITLMERSPIISFLLADSIRRAQHSEDPALVAIAKRMHLQGGNAIDWMRDAVAPLADVIYLDPMYPAREKNALVKKEMRAFHDLVGENLDDHELLEAALTTAEHRVVVKRPRKGDRIDGPLPQLVLSGKSARYDVYTLKAFPK
jgi:16S rRNA (guanine1516-N2)-methyltransferase